MTTSTTSTSKLKEKVVESKVKLIINTVLERCEKESVQNMLIVPLEACEQRASYYTAFPSYCFFELREQNKQLPPKSSYNIRQKITILNGFKALYATKKHIENKQIYELFSNNNFLKPPDPALYLRRELCSMGYEYKKAQCGWTIVENPELRYERFNFLNKIIKLRNKNRQICYVEVRVIDKSLEFQKLSTPARYQDNNSTYYFLHVISRNGYINGIFCNEMDSELFTKWVTDVLVTLLTPEAVLVIDTGDLFNEKIIPITRYSSKQDMVHWLTSNNIPFTSGMYKPELYDLIMKSGIKDSEYKIDHILKAHGHDVLRLPQKFHDLTPTELLWKHMRTEEYHESLLMVGLKSAIENHISNIENLKWELFSDAIANWEKEIFDIDIQIEHLLDYYNFDTQCNIDFGTSIPEYFFAENDDPQENPTRIVN